MNSTSTKPVIIYGNGHMAKMLFHFIKAKHTVVCFTVDKHCINSEAIEGLPVIPFSEITLRFPAFEYDMLIVVGISEMNHVRERKYLEALEKGYQLINYIHPSVDLHDNIKLGQNNIILEHASLHPYTVIGNGNFISSNTNLGHGCIVGDFCWINAGVSVGGETRLGNKCFYGMNASVSNGLNIGDESFIGANTFISHDTLEKEVYLSETGKKFRLDSEHFLKFSAAL